MPRYNTEKKMKEEYKNKNYSNVGSNYNYETGEYNNLKHLNLKRGQNVNEILLLQTSLLLANILLG